MEAPAVGWVSPEEYLARERNARSKSEYYKGEIFAMAGASEAHVLISTNLIRELATLLRGRACRVYAADLRVKVEAAGLYTYPDIVVVCGERRLEDSHRDTLLNPTVIIEILSPSTEAYDRGAKFELYRKLESLREYLMVSQDRVMVEHYVRDALGDEWGFREVTGDQSVLHLPSIDAKISLGEVYYGLEHLENTGPTHHP